MLFVSRVFHFFKKDRDFARSFSSGKLILAAAGPTVDSLFFGQVEIASGKRILATVGPMDRLLKKLISIPVEEEASLHDHRATYVMEKASFVLL